MCSVFLGLGCRSGPLETCAGAGSAAIARGHRNKFHEVESDVLIAARSCRGALCFVHEVSPKKVSMNLMIAKLGATSRSAISRQESQLFLQRRAYNNHVGSWAGRPLDASFGTRREESPNSREQCAG